jgi:hypothetical protein
MNKLASTLHDATHIVPGVPTHSDTPATHQPHRTGVTPRHNKNPRLQNPNRHHQTPPRVLIAWQNWIGRLLFDGGCSRQNRR